MSPFLTTLGGGSVRGFGRAFRRIISGPTTAATSLSATPASTSVQLSWTNTNAAAQIRVYRAATLVTTLSAASTSYTNTGLSSETSYSYTVVYIENGIEGPASNTATTTTLAASGQQAYTTAGTYTFTVPAGVTYISAFCVGAGSGNNNNGDNNSGTGGSTSYVNDISVTPGESLTVNVPEGFTGIGTAGERRAYISRSGTKLVAAKSGYSSADQTGTYSDGGSGGANTNGGGGGAGGYGGNTKTGGDAGNQNQVGQIGVSGYGAGGGGGGGGNTSNFPPNPNINDFAYSNYGGGGGGGGVGLLGSGSRGAGGAATNGGTGGAGGSGGNTGGSGGASTNGSAGNGGTGGAYGGGGGAGGYSYTFSYVGNDEYAQDDLAIGSNANGAGGAVRIIWGTGRSYPSAAANV